jgi:SAM-dependent methyltransferase
MNESFTVGRGLRQWWRDSRRQRGRANAMGCLLADFWGVLRDLTPARRRLRFGDLDYDWEHGVNTTWANPSLLTRVKEVFAGRQYMPTDPELFRQLIEELAIDYGQYTFIDLGCGKGRALLLASEFPFRRIIGVELLPELFRIAQENIRCFQQGAQSERIELWCGDGRRFQFPTGPLVVFLFDPFPEFVLEDVLSNLQRSVEADPRDTIVVYQNPISEHVLSGATWLTRLGGDVTAAVYRARTTTKPSS